MERKPYDAKAAKARAIADGESFYSDGDGFLRCVHCDARITMPRQEVDDRGRLYRKALSCPRCKKK